MSSSPLPAAEALELSSLIATIPGGVASRVLAKAAGGNVTLFAFDAGQGLTEHTSPFDALVLVLDGEFAITVAGALARAAAGSLFRLPADVPHALEAVAASRMLLVMLREGPAG